MNIASLFRGIAVVLAAILAWGIYLLITQWQYQSVGPFEARVNQLTGIAQVKNGGKWEAFGVDPYADVIPAPTLARVGVQDIAWGNHGLLCGRLVNENGEPVSGRLAIRVVIRKTKDGALVKDRSLRGAVSLPPRGTLPFALTTALESPDPQQTRTFIELQPINLGGT